MILVVACAASQRDPQNNEPSSSATSSVPLTKSPGHSGMGSASSSPSGTRHLWSCSSVDDGSAGLCFDELAECNALVAAAARRGKSQTACAPQERAWCFDVYGRKDRTFTMSCTPTESNCARYRQQLAARPDMLVAPEGCRSATRSDRWCLSGRLPYASCNPVRAKCEHTRAWLAKGLDPEGAPVAPEQSDHTRTCSLRKRTVCYRVELRNGDKHEACLPDLRTCTEHRAWAGKHADVAAVLSECELLH